MDAMQRLRARLKALLDERLPGGKLKQYRLAAHVAASEGKQTPKGAAWISNILAGRRDLRLKNLDAVAEFFNLPPADLVMRDEDELIEVTPTERALVRRFRRMDVDDQNAILTMAHLREYRKQTLPYTDRKPSKRPPDDKGKK